MASLLETAASNAVVAAVLALVVFAVACGLRRPALAHGLWIVVLLKLLTPSIIAIPLPAWWPTSLRVEVACSSTEAVPRNPVDVPRSTGPQAVADSDWQASPRDAVLFSAGGESGNRIGATTGASWAFDAADRQEAQAVPSGQPLAAQVAITSLEPREEPRDIGWALSRVMTILIWVWLAGTLAAFTLSAVRVHRFRRAMRWATPASAAIQQEAAQIARRIGLRDHPRVWLVSGAVSPMLWAIFGHTRLLFPSRLLEDLAPVARRALLLHELAHLRRRDHWVRLLEATATILYWWHPVVWWARREIQAAEETCCDSWVVSGMPEDRGVYAAALIETERFLSESHLPLPALASGVQGFMVMKRRVTLIMRMCGDGPSRLSPGAWAGLLTFAAICLPLVPTLAQVPQGSESPAAAAASAARPPVEAISAVVAEAKPQSTGPTVATVFPEPAGLESLPHRGVGRRARHIWSLAFSPDGRTIAVGSGEWDLAGELHLLDVATGQVLARERVRQGVASVAFSPDGTLVASCSWHGHLRMHKTDGLVLVHDIPLQSVARVAFSPDGKTIATAAEGWSKDAAPGRRVELWDVATGTQRRLLDGDLFRLHCVAFSRDGNLVAAGGGRWEQNRMGEVRLWNAETGKQTARLVGHQGPVFGLAFSPDGKTVATGALDATIRFWDPATGQQKREIQAHDSWVEGLSFSPDGKMLASSSLDGAGKLWDVATGQLLTTFTGHEGWVRQARFSPDGTTLATAGEDGKVQFWDVAKRERRQTIVPPDWLTDPTEPVTCVAYSPDGKTVATAHDSKTVRLRDPATGDVRTLLVGHEGAVSSVAYSADGKTLATASCDKTVRLWDAATGQARTTLEGHTDWVLAAVFSPDGKMLASCGKDKTVRLWDLATGRELARLEGHTDLVRAVAFSADGKRLASTGADHCVKVWDTDARKEVFSLTGAAGTAVVFSPDGTTLASPMVEDRPGQLSAVYLWDMKTAKLRNSVTGQRTTVWSLVFSPGGQTLASGSLDGSIVLWDVASGKSLQEVRSHQGTVTTVAFAPDSSTLVSGGADATLNLWDTKLRPIPPLLTFLPGHGAVRSVAFSPDGRALATSGEDGKARLWAVETLQPLRELGDHLGAVTSFAFSPDGQRVALGGADWRITIWDARDGRRLAELMGHKGEVTALRFSPDGKRLASSAHDSEVRVWDVEAAREVFRLKHLIISQCLDWSPDGRLLCASAEEAGETVSSHPVILWNAETGQEIARLRGHRSYVTLVRFSPDGKRLATSASDTQLHLWDVATRKILGSMTAEWGAPDARFLPDGQTLAVAMHIGRFGLWDLSTYRETVRYEGHGPFTVGGTYGWGIYGVAISPDGSVVASTDSRGLVKFWPTFRGTRDPTNAAASLAKLAAAVGPVTPDPAAAPVPSGLVYSVAAQKSGVLFAIFSPDGKLLAAGGEDGTVAFLDAETGRVLKTVSAHNGAVHTGVFSPDGCQFATGGSDRSVKRWDIESGRQLGNIQGSFALIRTVAFTDGGENFVSVSDSGLFRRFETETDGELSKVNFSPMAWMALSPDGKLAARASWDTTVGVSNLQDSKEVAVLRGHYNGVLSTAFSPDGRLLVSTAATLDPKHNAKLWDAGTWKERAALEGHRGYVHCATFSPDGKTIATCGADLTIRLWNAADGKPLRTLRGHTASVVFVRFSPDGRRLASASLDGTVKVWNLGFDSSTASRETLPVSEVYGLKHARADAIAKELTSLFAGQKNCRFAADAQKNALVVFAPLDQRNKIQERIRSLDVPASPDRNTLDPKESQKPPGTPAPTPTPAAGAPVQLEAIEGLDVLIVRGNRRDVAQLMEDIKRVGELSATNAAAIERLNGLLFSRGHRAVAQDGKIVVAPVTVKFDFAFKSWREVIESFAKQTGLAMDAKSLPPGTFNYRDTREYTPTEGLELLDSVLRTKGYAIALRDYKLVVTTSPPIENGAAARQSESMNQLKHIALAMHNYHDVRKMFPPAYLADKNAKPLLSWRVLILPYLDQNSLYREFHLNEPWDSQHNKKLIERMPAAYRSPGSKTAPGMTNYLTVRAPNAVFPGKDGVSIRQITDGTSNTIMVVEASDQKAVVWTKPDDFEYNDADPLLAGLIGLRPKGFLAALCDGSALLIPSSVEKETLRRLFVRNDGKPIPSPLGSAAEEQRWTVQIVDDSAVIQATESTANRLIQATIHAIQESGTEKFTLRRIDKPGSTVRDAKQTFSIRMIGSEAEINCSRDVPYKYLANMIQRLREAGVRKTKIASTSEERPER